MNRLSAPLLAELAAIKAAIDAARAIVQDGHMPDMGALEKRIGDVCLSIQSADADEQGHYLPELAALLKSLDDCDRTMRRWNEAQQKAGTP